MSSEQLCLGRIKKICNYHMDVSLIHGARGRVKITDISTAYREALEQLLSGENVNVSMLSEMFTVGQVVRCSVKVGEDILNKTEKLKTNIVELSLNPSQVNRNVRKNQIKSYITLVGSVNSVEDNGYTIDSGIRNLTVFLPFDEAPLKGSRRYPLGSLVEFTIPEDQIKKDNARVVRATMLKFRKINESANPPFDSLLPGVRIPIKIESTSLEGLECSFNFFRVHVPAQHCPSEVSKYKKKTQELACIIGIDLGSKAIIASLLPHFVKDDSPEGEELKAHEKVKVGAICDDAKLKRRERNCVYLWMPSLKRCGLLLKSNAFDGPAPKRWTSEFPDDKTFKCRVIDFDLFLNVPIISCKQSVLESKFLFLEDVKVGATVPVTIKKFLKKGVSVHLNGSIRGVVPFFHLSDATIKKPEERFKVGNKLNAMVLSVDLEKQELQLTSKKSLISSNLPLLGSSNMTQAWAEFEKQPKYEAKPLLVTAFIVQSSDKGVLVCGVNNVRGWIPRNHTLVDADQSIENFFSRGDTVQLRVLKKLRESSSRNSGRPCSQYLLSQFLDPKDVASKTAKSPEVDTSAVSLGDVFFCRVHGVTTTGLQVGLCRTATSGVKDEVTKAFLPYTHLSDSVSIARLARQHRVVCFKPSELLAIASEAPTRVVVVSITSSEVLVSAKSSLLAAAEGTLKGGGFVRSVDQLIVGSQWVGWVVNHKPYGIFVELPGALRGLAPARFLSDRRAPPDTAWPGLLPLGASVEAKVVEISTPQHSATPRFILSLRMMDTYVSAAEQYLGIALERTRRYLQECHWICSKVNQLNALNTYAPGDLVQFRVAELTETTVEGTVEASSQKAASVAAAALLPNTAGGVECCVGGLYPAVVTLPNPESGRVEVALLPWLLKGVRQRVAGEFTADAMKPRVGQSVASCVVATGNGRDLVVVGLKQQALGHLALLPARRSLNDIIGANDWALGQVNRVTLRSEIPAGCTVANFLATLTIYDPIGASAVKKSKPSSDAQQRQETTTTVELVPGTRLPEVVFLGLRGRNALYRLPQTPRNSRTLASRLLCRLVDLGAQMKAKSIRAMIQTPPAAGTVFNNAVVLCTPPPTIVSSGGLRLPLSSRMTRISFFDKEPEVGDLVCGMFLGVSGLSWRLLLPNNTHGLLHFSCMSKSNSAETDEEKDNASHLFPLHPKHGVWVNCRLIDVATSEDRVCEGEEEENDAKELNEQQEDEEQGEEMKETPLFARGDEVIPVGDDGDMLASKAPSKVFYVSTDPSDLRSWNAEKYKELELELTKQPVNGSIKRRMKRVLVVSLNYKTDVTVPYTVLPKNLKRGSTIEIVLTSLKPLMGRLVNEPTSPMRRRRSASTSQAAGAQDETSPVPSKRRRLVSFNEGMGGGAGSGAAPTIGDIRQRYADFLAPLPTSEENKTTKAIQQEEDAEMTEESPAKTAGLEASLLASLENELHMAEVAQATSTANASSLPRLNSVEAFEVAVRNAPTDARLWCLYAAHHHASGDLERARATLRRALASPAATAAGTSSEEFVGTLLLAFLKLESNVEATQKVTGIGGEKSTATGPTASLLAAVVARIENLDKEGLTKRSVAILTEAGLHQQAEAMAKKYVRGHAEVPEAWLMLIRVRFRSGNVFGAREAQRNAGQTLRLSQIPLFAVGCARLEFEFGDIERAIKLMEEQVAAHPQKKVVYINYIQLLQSAGKGAEAQTVRETALSKLSKKDHASVNKLFDE